MQVLVDVPDELIQLLGESSAGISRATTETLVVRAVRENRLSDAQAQAILGMQSRFEFDGLLKDHGVMLPYTPDDYLRDGETALRHSLQRQAPA